MELQIIQNKIFEIRGQHIMLDFDLAELYQVETRVLNQAMKRNIKRFPSDFMFELSPKEWEILRTQFATSSWGGVRYQPLAFTEQGVAMLANVLLSLLIQAISKNREIRHLTLAHFGLVLINVQRKVLKSLKLL